jgi:hypothetical protein
LVTKELSKYLKYSNQTLLSLHLISAVTYFFFISFSLNTGNNIDNSGGKKLFEALKSNKSLAALNLSSNSLVASFMLTQY